MRNQKRTLAGEVLVDGDEYTWQLVREPQWSTTDGWRGMVIALRHAKGEREVHVEWPMPHGASRSVPYRQRPKVDASALKSAVRTAMENGWNPMSRGRPVHVLLG